MTGRQEPESPVRITLNGRSVEAVVAPRTTLRDLLHDHLGCTEVKLACAEGVCGACAVLVDGTPLASCIKLALQADGCEITTVAGLSRIAGRIASTYELLRNHMIARECFQCGYCAPGFLVEAAHFLASRPVNEPAPSTHVVRHALSGHICRCTGYQQIVEAVAAAAAGEAPPLVPELRLDERDKIDGVACYPTDQVYEGQLIGRVLWSAHASALISGLDTSEAKAVPGVVCVLTHRDVPGKNVAGESLFRADQPLLANGRVACMGDAVAVVAAHTDEAARLALRRIKVTYKVQPAIFDPLSALAPGAPNPGGRNNTVAQFTETRGDVEQGLRDSDVIVEGTYECGINDHVCMEREGGVGRWNGGIVEITIPSLTPHAARASIARCLGIPEEKVRMHTPRLGGSFGKYLTPGIEALLALHLSGPPQLEPDAVAEFDLGLDSQMEPGTNSVLQVRFPEDAETLSVHATVSSHEFSQPAGEQWSNEFVVDRNLDVTPANWTFKARALGDRRQYSMLISFNAAGNALGAVSFTATRKGVAKAVRTAKHSAQVMALPARNGAGVVICITERPGNSNEIVIYRNGKRVDKPIPWISPGDEYFRQLELADTDSKLMGVALGLSIEVPQKLLDLFNSKDLEGVSTLFMSDSRVAPFEVLQLRPSSNGPLLGVDRPVIRWPTDCAPQDFELESPGIACIRPKYPEPDALPSAKEEESDLRQRFPNMCVARTVKDVEGLSSRNDIRVVHFAGHAQAAPPQLILEDGTISPYQFHPSKLLMKEAQPLFFINGCRAGQAHSAAPAILSNFAKVLLKSNASGFIAPMIAINSSAARKAARSFYDSLRTKTVAEAVCEIHRLSATCPEAEKATVLSYTAFVGANMRMRF